MYIWHVSYLLEKILCKYFVSIFGLYFYSSNSVLLREDIFDLDVNFIKFYFLVLYLGHI